MATKRKPNVLTTEAAEAAPLFKRDTVLVSRARLLDTTQALEACQRCPTTKVTKLKPSVLTTEEVETAKTTKTYVADTASDVVFVSRARLLDTTRALEWHARGFNLAPILEKRADKAEKALRASKRREEKLREEVVKLQRQLSSMQAASSAWQEQVDRTTKTWQGVQND